MFHLESAITDWRNQMLAAGVQSPVPLEELEIHLREEIERQVKTGLDQQTAFQTALDQLGSAPAIKDEFDRAAANRDARNWKLMEAILPLLTLLISLGIGSLLWLRAGPIGMTTMEETSSLVAVTLFCLLAWTGRLSSRSFPVIASHRHRTVIGVAGGVAVAFWWMIFLRLIVPSQEFDGAQFVETFVWAWFPPAGVWVGLFWGIEAAARNKTAASIFEREKHA
ncbi:MAG TPA: permease prefix domain 1-containing protein [Verrucomicrobiae bacterium]|jgi:hypothetical protein